MRSPAWKSNDRNAQGSRLRDRHQPLTRRKSLRGGHLQHLEGAEGVLARVGNVQEAVLVLVLLVDAGHQRSGWWQDLVDEDEDGLLWRELDALADDIDELADGEVGWDEILLLIDGGDLGLLDLLADDLGVMLA